METTKVLADAVRKAADDLTAATIKARRAGLSVFLEIRELDSMADGGDVLVLPTIMQKV